MEITQSEQQTESQMKNESNIRDLWDNVKHVNLCILGIPKGEEIEKWVENVFEDIIAENFPNLKKEIYTSTGSTEGPKQDKPKRPTPIHIIIKMAKVKERIIKVAREKQRVNYKGTPIRPSADFSTETLQARREWQYIFKS